MRGKKFKKKSLRAGFEPARENPNRFLICRLNHSAIAADGRGGEQNFQYTRISYKFSIAFTIRSYSLLFSQALKVNQIIIKHKKNI
jgi:hypothetical protein